MEDDSGEYINDITADLMQCLSDSNFFSKSDDQLSPASAAELPKHCAHDYAISEAILNASNFPQKDIADVFDELRAQGGFCDCEILFNAAPSNRLKANYWKKRAVQVKTENSKTPRPRDPY